MYAGTVYGEQCEKGLDSGVTRGRQYEMPHVASLSSTVAVVQVPSSFWIEWWIKRLEGTANELTWVPYRGDLCSRSWLESPRRFKTRHLQSGTFEVSVHFNHQMTRPRWPRSRIASKETLKARGFKLSKLGAKYRRSSPA